MGDSNSIGGGPLAPPSHHNYVGDAVSTVHVDYKRAAAYLGLRLKTLQTMVSRKQVPHLRLSGRLVVFDLRDLDRWLETRRCMPTTGR